MIDFSEFDLIPPSFPSGVHKVIWKGIRVGQSKRGTKLLELDFLDEKKDMYREVLYVSDKSASVIGKKLVQLAAYTFGLQKARTIKADSYESLCDKINPMLANNNQKIKILITEEEYEGKIYRGLKSNDIASPENSMVLDAIYETMEKRKAPKEELKEEIDDPFSY
jgi:hypothetical protein